MLLGVFVFWIFLGGGYYFKGNGNCLNVGIDYNIFLFLSLIYIKFWVILNKMEVFYRKNSNVCNNYIGEIKMYLVN